MFSWLSILKGLLTLANVIAQICHDKQEIDAGKFEAIAANNAASLEHIQKALDARAGSSKWPTPDELRNDPDNIDNHS